MNLIGKLVTWRKAAGRKVGPKVVKVEAFLHFAYGLALFTEGHEITVYGSVALALGTAVLINGVVGEA